ncbi:MAG: sulfotransferase [Pseudomonadota bacterium]
MKGKIHFISGLPRSGSTLLAGILLQNPRFHAAMTSPVGALFNAMVEAMSPGNEFALFISPEQRRELLESLFTSYYRKEEQKEVTFDTNRLWCSRLSALNRLFPEAKVICCVRSVAWIMDSIERLVRKNAFENSRLFANPSEKSNIYTRVEALARHDRMVGSAWSALREAYYGEQSSCMLLVEYESLAGSPEETLSQIYRFIGEEPFTHDFDNVEYEEQEFDRLLGVDGLHKVARKVAFRPRETILPPDLFERYDKLTFWHNRKGTRAEVHTAPSPPEGSQIETG